MVLLCCSADGTKKICQSIISKFVKPHGLKALRNYPHDYKSHKKTQVTGRFSSECLVSFEGKNDSPGQEYAPFNGAMCCPQ
jgi:hypothetical protein